MIKIKVTDAHSGFFDRKAIIDAIGRSRAAVMSKIGAKVRSHAQSSLKYDDKSSVAGQPPHVHKKHRITKTSKTTGKTRTRTVSLLRELLEFKWDSTTKSEVIGPAKAHAVKGIDAPHTLEYGGSASIIDFKNKRHNVNIAARPFMSPAFAAEQPGFEALWKDSVK